MTKFKFGKLVRDKIIEHQIASGAIPSYHILNDAQHKQELINKIIEEAQEITDAPPDKIATEIADVQQAIDDLKDKFGLTNSEIAKAQTAKAAKNGTFKKGIFVHHVELDETSKWAKYYRKNPDRYPEIGE
jgi:predicted house-cleaning noncanonical NTP pyrophosphatase (MazG superfamily)